MIYYGLHDQEYKKRLAAGQVAWDKGEYETFDMLPLIKRLIKESKLAPSESTALDLGCGTGGLACFLAKQGFKVTAIDISSTAIGEAKSQATSRGLNIDFQVADLCHEKLPENTFDIITDNHFLHCIVFSHERYGVLQNIHRALKPEGEYWIENMIGHPKMTPPAEWNLDADGITWCIVSEDKRVEGCINRNGKNWRPIRRIQPSETIQIEELCQANFEIVWHETTPPLDENDTGAFRAKCR